MLSCNSETVESSIVLFYIVKFHFNSITIGLDLQIPEFYRFHSVQLDRGNDVTPNILAFFYCTLRTVENTRFSLINVEFTSSSLAKAVLGSSSLLSSKFASNFSYNDNNIIYVIPRRHLLRHRRRRRPRLHRRI